MKNAIAPELLRFDKNQKVISYDFETCNLCLSEESVNKPWQLGWTTWAGGRKLEGREDWLKWDPLPMGRDAARITGFDWMLYHARAVDPEPIYEQFAEKLYDPDYLFLGANLFNFDIYMVGLWQRLLGRPIDYSFCSRTICVQNLRKAEVLGVPLPKIGTPEWVAVNFQLSNYHERKLKTNLKFLAGEYGVAYDESLHHVSAEYDCDLTYQIFQKQLYQNEI